MGCASSTSTSTQPAKGSDKDDVIVTSDITDHDFASTDKKIQKAAVSKTTHSSVPPLIQANGISQHKTQQQIKEQTQQQNSEPKSTTNGAVTSSKASSGKSREDNIAIENVEDLIGNDVKPKPTRKKKVEIMSDPNMFEAIDSHVARTPESVCSSIPTLAEYLIKPAKTPLERARAVYKWITTNIAYDIDGYMGRSERKSCSSGDVLSNRSSVCAGYSNLFESLCRCAHVPVKVINGYAKGYSHKDTEDFDLSKMDTNHAWNAIFVEGEWRLVDSTWDAGYVDGKSFHWQKQDLYFLMDPEYFVSSHLPYIDKDLVTSELWQLLDKPVNPKTFFKSLKLEGGAVKFGVFPKSHKETIVHVKGETCIEIQKSTPGEIIDTLISFESEDENEEYNECVATERSGNDVIKFHVRPPKPGTYKLNLFICAPKEKTKWPQLFKYIIKCDSVLGNLVLFPKHRQTYGPQPDYKELGFGEGTKKHSFFSTNTGELEIVLPTIAKLSVSCTLEDGDSNKIQNAVFQQSTANSLSLSLRLPRKGNYRLIVFGKKGDENNYSVAANFLVQCTNVVHEFRPFPVVYGGKATDYQIILHEPKAKEIPANSSVVFRFSSPSLKSVQIDKKVFKKENDGDEWKISFDTPGPGTQVNVFGSNEETGTRNGLFGYITK